MLYPRISFIQKYKFPFHITTGKTTCMLNIYSLHWGSYDTWLTMHSKVKKTQRTFVPEASWKLELSKPYRYHFLKHSWVVTKLLRNSLCAAFSYFEGKLIKTKITSARFEKVVWIFVFFEPITKFGMHSHPKYWDSKWWGCANDFLGLKCTILVFTPPCYFSTQD